MRIVRVWLSLAAAACVLFGASLVEAQRIRVTIAPPPARAEAAPPAPWTGAVWQPGYWHWNGRAWTWRRGRYMRPRVGYEYGAPRWENVGGVWVYRRGGWRRHRGAPVVVAPGYPQPGVVVVQDGRPPPPTVVVQPRRRRGGTVVIDTGRPGGRVRIVGPRGRVRVR